jgi:hypothetical protein
MNEYSLAKVQLLIMKKEITVINRPTARKEYTEESYFTPFFLCPQKHITNIKMVNKYGIKPNPNFTITPRKM